ncbi:MAG: energy-coupling factor transporter transmembrane protein EcfT [Anaerolineae bacterium]|nr:energy-coupling factor transporter transmembrane protein EcfT [Anaerolineae bacterium]
MLEYECRHSLLERLDPRTKLLLVGILSAGALFADSWASLLVLLAAVLLLWKIGRLSFRKHRLIMGMLAFGAGGTVLTQSIFYTASPAYAGPSTVLFHLLPVNIPITGRLSVTLEGARYGALIALRLAIMMLSAPLVPLTTHPSRLMSSLVALRLPFFLVAIVTMALRFVPLVQANLLWILDAQRVRGIRTYSLRGMGMLLSTLLIVTLRTAHDLSLSLETRAFRPLARRTFYREVRPSALDGLAVGVTLLWLGVALRL